MAKRKRGKRIYATFPRVRENIAELTTNTLYNLLHYFSIFINKKIC
jgi:hypothetical protein